MRGVFSVYSSSLDPSTARLRVRSRDLLATGDTDLLHPPPRPPAPPPPTLQVSVDKDDIIVVGFTDVGVVVWAGDGVAGRDEVADPGCSSAEAFDNNIEVGVERGVDGDEGDGGANSDEPDDKGEEMRSVIGEGGGAGNENNGDDEEEVGERSSAPGIIEGEVKGEGDGGGGGR